MSLLRYVALAGAVTLLTSCYTLKQGYYQTKLIFAREPLDDILKENKETAERLEKLKFVPTILDYANQTLGLKTGKSYRHYVKLQGDSVTYVVQAAHKRKLEGKTWWFPIVGTQPYLGFFVKDDAIKFRDELTKEGFDTTVGGVQAFSLLGYFPDPLYSSMIDRNNLTELAELLFHECTHQTVYIPNHSAFNENLAEFVARQGVKQFFSEHRELNADLKAYQESFDKGLVAGPKYRSFLETAKRELEDFYSAAQNDASLKDDKVFLEKRELKFNEISGRYLTYMGGVEKGTRYEWYFKPGRLNNAVILGYSLYEAKQAPFEKLFEKAGKNIPAFLKAIGTCLKDGAETEDELWTKTEKC